MGKCIARVSEIMSVFYVTIKDYVRWKCTYSKWNMSTEDWGDIEANRVVPSNKIARWDISMRGKKVITEVITNRSTKEIVDKHREAEGWQNHINQIRYSQVRLQRRWESRVRLRHDSLTSNLEILIFSSQTEGKKSYLWEAFRQNGERCGRICFCQRESRSACMSLFHLFTEPLDL